MKELKRLNYIDIAKGFAVLFVILGHSLRETMRIDHYWCDFLYGFVYRFHVPLLFILSGMSYALTKQNNLELASLKYVKKKAKSLLLPYISYSVIIYGVFAVMQTIPQFSAVLAGRSYEYVSPFEYLAMLFKNDNPYCFHVWYLQTLFLYLIITYWSDKTWGERTSKILKIAVIISAPFVYKMFCSETFWAIKAFMQNIIFFSVGSFITDEFIGKYTKKLLPVGIICGLGIAFFVVNPFVFGLYEIRCVGVILTYVEDVIVLGFCIAVIAACAVFEDKLNKMATFGRNTMIYYLYHQPFCCAFLGIILYDKVKLPIGVAVPGCIAAGIAIPYTISLIAKKTRLCVVFKKLGLPM